MQYGNSTPPLQAGQNTVSGAFELKVPNGWYAVTASVGDQMGTTYDSLYSINAEGVALIDKFQGSAAKEYTTATKTVQVTDGRLTVDAIGGTNTKLNYLEVDTTDAPDLTVRPRRRPWPPRQGTRPWPTWAAGTESDLAIYRVYRTAAGVSTTGEGIAGLVTTVVHRHHRQQRHVLLLRRRRGGHFRQRVGVHEVTAEPQGVQLHEKYSFTTSADAAVPAGYTKQDGSAWTIVTGIGWVTQESIATATHVPLNLSANTRVRTRPAPVTALQNRLIHMQYGDAEGGNGTNGIKTAGAFERAVPNGWYDVTVSVGDQMGGSGYDSQYTVNVEGTKAIDRFQASAAQEYKTATVTVRVSDSSPHHRRGRRHQHQAEPRHPGQHDRSGRAGRARQACASPTT